MSCFVTVRFFLLKVTINRQLKFKLIFGLSATPTNRQSLLSAIYFVQNENCNSRNSVVTAIYLHSYIQRVYTYISYAHCCAVRPFPQSPFHVIRFLAVSWDFFPRCAIKLRISFCFALFFRRVLDFLSRVNTKTRIARAWRCFFRAFLFYVYIYIYMRVQLAYTWKFLSAMPAPVFSARLVITSTRFYGFSDTHRAYV